MRVVSTSNHISYMFSVENSSKMPVNAGIHKSENQRCRKKRKSAPTKMVVKINQCYRIFCINHRSKQQWTKKKQPTTYEMMKKIMLEEKLLSVKIPIITMMHRFHFSSPTSNDITHTHNTTHVCVLYIYLICGHEPHINISAAVYTPTIDLTCLMPIMYF